MNEKKLVIGLPTMGYVDWRFASSLMGLQLLQDTRVIWMVKTMINAARNNLVKQALSNPNYTHMLMIDDDMTFQQDFAKRLLNHDVDVVGGLAFKRREGYHPCVYRKKDGEYIPIIPKIFQEVDVVGSGGILIKMEVFKKLKFPWFETYYDKKGQLWSVDFDFCIKAKKAGFKIFCDPDAEMGHLGDAPEIKSQQFYNYIKQHASNKSNKHK